MQPAYRSSHGPSTRRGIGPMVSGGAAHQTAAQAQAQADAMKKQSDLAKRRSRKPTDKNIPDGLEDYIIGDGVKNYRALRDLERRLDAAMMRKRLDIYEAVNRHVKEYRTLRVWISNTVEDQPWQNEGDGFDMAASGDASYTVKIEGRLLEDDMGLDDSDDEDEPPARKPDGTAAPPSQQPTRLSHFFKAMNVDFDRNDKVINGVEQSVEWKKPATNALIPPNSADFDLLEFKRTGDRNMNVTINLVRDEEQERFSLSAPLVSILDTTVATRLEVQQGIWAYVKAMGLIDEEEKRSFHCDDTLRQIFGRDIAYVPQINEATAQHMQPLPPISLPYTIRTDAAYHASPTPTIYDISVCVPSPVQGKFRDFVRNTSHLQSLREIANYNDHLALRIKALGHSKSKHAFFTDISRDPTGFTNRWISSQRRDLEVIMGEAARGGGEHAGGEEWRRGGNEGVWGTDNVKEAVNSLLTSRNRMG